MGLHETAAGRWKERFRFRLSFLRLKALFAKTSEGSRPWDIGDLPVECPKNLHDPVFATVLAVARQLDCERGSRVVAPMKRESFPAGAVGSTVLKLRRELLDSYKILIAVFVLQARQWAGWMER